MKKTILLFFFWLSFVSTYAETIPLSYTFDTSSIEFIEIERDGNVYVEPQISGLDNVQMPGILSIPLKYVSYAIPLSSCCISAEINYKQYSKSYILKHPLFQPNTYCETGYNNKNQDISENIESLFPDIVDVVHIENFKDLYKVVTIAICPFEIFERKELVCYDKISFNLKYSQEPSAKEKDTYVKWDENYLHSKYYINDLRTLQSMVQNPQDIEVPYLSEEQMNSVQTSITGPNGSAYEYTIITNRSMRDAFGRLVALKRVQGYNAGIVCIEDILSNSAFSNGDPYSNINDEAAKLKAYLIANKNIIRFVLLGGKPPIVPVRYGYQNASNKAEYDKLVPSDLYYGTGSGTDWNRLNNGYYGSYYNSPDGSFSYSSLFKIGRLLCTTNEDVNNYIDKLEIYELNPGFGDYSYLNKCYSHVDNDLSRNFSYYNNQINDSLNLLYSNRILSGGLSCSHTGSYVMNELNEDHYSFLLFNGHGNPQEIHTYETFVPRQNSDSIVYLGGLRALQSGTGTQYSYGLDNMDNFGFPSILYAHSCSTTPHDSPKYNGYGFNNPSFDGIEKNFEESYILGKNYGGCAYIGYPRSTRTYFGYYHEREFLRQMIKRNSNRKSLGEIMNLTRVCLGNFYTSYHLELLEISLFGDPSLSIWSGTENVSDLTVQNLNRLFNGIQIELNPSIVSGPTLVFLTPDGNMSLGAFNNNQTFFNVNRLSQVCIIGDNTKVPYIGDIIINDYQFNQDDYFYCKSLKLGQQQISGSNRVEITNCKVTFDAKEDITIYNNVVVGNHGQLYLYSPDTCYLKGVNVSNGGRLIINANSVVSTTDISQQIAAGRIIINGYDKYGVMSSTNSLIKPIVKTDDVEAEYTPLLEIGKEWRYTGIEDQVFSYPGLTIEEGWEYEQQYKYKVTGTKIVDDKEYFVLSYIVGDQDISEEGYVDTNCLLREDIENKQVWALIDMWNYQWQWDCYLPFVDVEECWAPAHEKLIYDFNWPYTSGYIAYRIANDWDSYVVETDLEIGGESTIASAYGIKGYDPGVGVAQAIGMFSIHKSGCRGVAYDLIGLPIDNTTSAPSWMYFPYLYEVVDGNGKTIYYDYDHRPGCTGRAVINADQVKIECAGGYLIIHSSVDCMATIYNAAGMEVRQYTLHDGFCSINTSELPSGIYFINLADKVYKFIVR